MAYWFEDDKSQIRVGKIVQSYPVEANSKMVINVETEETQYIDPEKIHILAIKQRIGFSSSQEWLDANTIKNSGGETFPKAAPIGTESPGPQSTTKIKTQIYNNTNEMTVVEFAMLYAIM